MKTSILIIVFLFFSNYNYAQVTIGTNSPPAEGALLQLKSNTGSLTNSTLGLLLPRVRLYRHDLLRMGDHTILDTDHGGNQFIQHEGMIVYNTNKSSLVCPGLHVWNGSQWEILEEIKVKQPDIQMVDNSGNTYTAKWYQYDPCVEGVGNYWVVENLRTFRNKADQLMEHIYYKRAITTTVKTF